MDPIDRGATGFRTRLEGAVERVGRKTVYLAAKVSEGNLSRIINGHIENPGLWTVKAMADAAGVTIGELLGEPGFEISTTDRETLATFREWIAQKLEPARDARLEPNASDVPITTVELAPVTYLPGRVSPRASKIADASSEVTVPHFRAAADPNGMIDQDEENPPERDIPSFYASLGATKVFKTEGDSMIDAGITHHDLLFVRETTDVPSADGEIVICKYNGGTFVKQLDVRSGGVRLLSANRRYQPMVVDSTVKFSLVGVVVGRSGYPLKPPKPAE